MSDYLIVVTAKRWRFWPHTWPLGLRRSHWTKTTSRDRAVEIFDELRSMGAPALQLYEDGKLIADAAR